MVLTLLTIGMSIPLKLTKDNFLLRQMQLLLLLSSCSLDHLLEEEAPTINIVDEDGMLIPKPTYQVWRR